MGETYQVISQPVKQGGERGKVEVRRMSDGLVSMCKPNWLVQVSDGIYQARSKTKASRLDGLEWTTEG